MKRVVLFEEVLILALERHKLSINLRVEELARGNLLHVDPE